MPLRVVLDTDPGIDDSLAILLALASPEIDLAAVGVTGGNCSLADGVRNALNVLAVAGRSDLPVCAGVGLPLIRPPFTAPETHGDSGLGYARLPASPVGPANEHAVDLIIREMLARPGEVALVAVAPLTNVALMIVFSTVTSLVQFIAPNEMRGRVMSIYMLAFRGGMPLGSLVSGYLATLIGAPTVIGINGALLVCVAIYFLARSHGVREA